MTQNKNEYLSVGFIGLCTWKFTPPGNVYYACARKHRRDHAIIVIIVVVIIIIIIIIVNNNDNNMTCPCEVWEIPVTFIGVEWANVEWSMEVNRNRKIVLADTNSDRLTVLAILLPTHLTLIQHKLAIDLINPFTPVYSISNFPCSLTRNITSHSMKKVAFHSLLRWKMITL